MKTLLLVLSVVLAFTTLGIALSFANADRAAACTTDNCVVAGTYQADCQSSDCFLH